MLNETDKSIICDKLYELSHKNIVNIEIYKNLEINQYEITFKIRSLKNYLKTYHFKYNLNIYLINKHNIDSYLHYISYKANKFSEAVDEIPDYIPECQTTRWINTKLKHGK